METKKGHTGVPFMGTSEWVRDSGLKETPDGTYRAPTLNLDEVVNTFSKLGLLSETEVLGRFKERLFNFTGIQERGTSQNPFLSSHLSRASPSSS